MTLEKKRRKCKDMSVVREMGFTFIKVRQEIDRIWLKIFFEGEVLLDHGRKKKKVRTF